MNDITRIRTIATRRRAQLLERAQRLADQPLTVTGLTWGISALDAVIRACDGQPDTPVRGRAPQREADGEQEDMFGGDAA